ncbi:MAG: glycosyltransferase family 2 protein [Bacteroidia bacterium]|nr:glycosyltransferase family 2 protein [Bacteroidia bacterium]
MDLSIVIPLLNERESLEELESRIRSVMEKEKYSYEILFIDDGSTDGSWDEILKLRSANPHVKGIRFVRNYGKSPALHCGFQMSKGHVVITMDADLQDSPEEIPALYRMIVHEGYDLVSGWKKKRHDPVLTKNIPSKLFNFVTSCLSGIRLHDMNCGLKAYKGELARHLEVFGEMHRFTPVLAKEAGYPKITEKEVLHSPRKHGKSKFGMSRFINGFLDLITLLFLSRFGKKPMHIFGLLGVMLFLIGFLFAAYLGFHKIYCVWNHIPARLITQRPSFYLSLTCIILGCMFFVAGFLGELILRNSPERNKYLIKETLA